MKEHIAEIIIDKPKSNLELLLENVKIEENILGMPDASKYYIIPHSKPILRSFINNFNWFFMKNLITFEVTENPQFTALNWLSDLFSRKENITLVIQDSKENELNRIQFNSIKLIKHKCSLSNIFEDSKIFKPVKHILLLKYQNVLIGKNKIDEFNENTIDENFI